MRHVLIFLFLFILHDVFAQIKISGRVTCNGKGIEGVLVQFYDESLQEDAFTDENGFYTISLPYLETKVSYWKGHKFYPETYYIDSSFLDSAQLIDIKLIKKPFFQRLFRVNRRKQVICGFCFVGGTRILMADDKQKNIEKVKEGDWIYSYNDSTGIKEIACVMKMDSVVHDNLIKVSFADGTILESTDDHPYWVKEKGWASFHPDRSFSLYGIPCKKLEAGDYCIQAGSDQVSEVQITAIEKLNKETITYNISKISGNHSYFANGIVVSTESYRLVK